MQMEAKQMHKVTLLVLEFENKRNGTTTRDTTFDSLIDETLLESRGGKMVNVLPPKSAKNVIPLSAAKNT